MKIKLEYVWLDGYKPEPNLRSKVKIVEYDKVRTAFLTGDFPMWNFDGSSTNQAETGNSDRLLKPVRHYAPHAFPLENNTVYVLCEVLNPDGTPHETNKRSQITEGYEDLWFGFEQEYFIREEINGNILGHKRNILKGQGEYYCGVGHNVVGREFVDEHLNMCLNYGIDITGINAEVALGQWEYQVFSQGKLKGGDDLWMTRYFLYKVAEKYNYHIELHPKPLTHGEWNGSGLHTNFSTDLMRNEGNEDYFMALFNAFESRHDDHIKVYGSQNHLRLTGEYETQSIHKFSWGVSDRGASIRVPQDTAKEWKGYVEDRRPGSNADPYKIIREIVKSLDVTEQIYNAKHMMNSFVDMDGLSGKYGTMSNDELLKEYREEETASDLNPQPQSDLVDELRKTMQNVNSNPKEENSNKTSKIPQSILDAMMGAKEVFNNQMKD